jgi:hypothetical protein
MQTTRKDHTPGPWHIGSEHDDNGDYRYDSCGWPHFVGDNRQETGRCDYHMATGIQNIADARLIAAAPDLLAALEEMTDMAADLLPKAGPSGWGEIAIDNARAAIAKATGQ